MKKLILIFIALNIIDLVLTYFILANGGQEIGLIFRHLSYPGIVMAKMALSGVVAYGIYHYRAYRVAGMLNAGLLLIVGWNAWAVSV